MSKKYSSKYSIIFKIAFLITFVKLCISAPVNDIENAYAQFIAELNRNECSVPNYVQLPFDTNKVENFEYLLPYLEICQKTESTQNKETVVLCKEIFDNIRNISCSTKIASPDISVKLSENVCTDIKVLKDSVPEDDNSLLKRLTDKFLCGIMCDGEFEKACQVLLWSFEVRKSIASITNSQEPEDSNVLEGGNIDGKQNAEEAKDVNEISEHGGTPQASELHNTNDNPDQNSDKTTNPDQNPKPEKSVAASETVSKNETAPEEGNENLGGSSKSSTIRLKTSSTLSTQTTIPDSMTETKATEEITRAETNVPNFNKQLQDIKHDKDAAENSLQISKMDGSDGQTRAVNVDDGKQVKDTKDTVLSDGHLQDNSNNPVNDKDENEITGEMPQNQDKNPDLISNKEHLHESKNEKTEDDTATDLLNNEQNPSTIVNTLPQNKLQYDENLAEKSNISSTDSETIKKTVNHQTILDVTLDKTSVVRDETGNNQTKTDAITHSHATSDIIKNAIIDQEQAKVPQQTGKLSNTIPDTTELSVTANEKEQEKSQKPKPVAVIPDDKNVIPSSPTETSTKTTVALEKMEGGNDFHQPAEEEADHYGDLENTEDDYSRPEYDGNLYDGSKNKESNPDIIPSPITVAKEIIANQNEKPIDFASRNSFGQDLNDIQMIGFPEQEDSHFFFYFLSIVLILMAGYLIFHNKQKIIALIVEGRHERSRRSHRIGYKKLETK